MGVAIKVIFFIKVLFLTLHDFITDEFCAFEFCQSLRIFLHNFSQYFLDLNERFPDFAFVIDEGLIFLGDFVHQADIIIVLNGFIGS
jgi:hypothetical protein